MIGVENLKRPDLGFLPCLNPKVRRTSIFRAPTIDEVMWNQQEPLTKTLLVVGLWLSAILVSLMPDRRLMSVNSSAGAAGLHQRSQVD